MKIIKPSHAIDSPLDTCRTLEHIERCGRTCYKTEHKIEHGSADSFVRNIVRRGHESVLEHFSFTVRFICDRGVSHELVRHRLCAISQESTRYANYSDGRFDGEITVIEPLFLPRGTRAYEIWHMACAVAEKAYFDMLGWGCSPQEARSVLPNSLKTEVAVTANLREWRHILKLRTSTSSHPQIREIMIPLLAELKDRLPAVFEDI